MSQVLSNVTILGASGSFRKLSGPATASTTSLTFSTFRNKALSMTVSSTVILREVTIYTQIGDWNHIDYNNKFQIVVASTNSVVYGNYIGWQSSWNATASTFNYYTTSSYNPDNLFYSTPIAQKIPLDIKLNPGSYELYLDEFFASNQNLGYILTTTVSNYPYTDPKGRITIKTSSNTNQIGWTESVGNIFFNWIISDEEELIVDNGNFNITNRVAGKQNPFSLNISGTDIFSIKNEDNSFAGGSILNKPSFVINPNSTNNSTVLKLLDPTGVDSFYNRQNNKVLVSNSSGVGSWRTYSNTNLIGQYFNFWNTGTTSTGDFIYATISNFGSGTGAIFGVNSVSAGTMSILSGSFIFYGGTGGSGYSIGNTLEIYGATTSSIFFVNGVNGTSVTTGYFLDTGSGFISGRTYSTRTLTNSYITNLGTSFNKNFTYNIIDNTSFSPINATVSFYIANTNSTSSNYYAVISVTNSGGPSVTYPGWKIIII